LFDSRRNDANNSSKYQNAVNEQQEPKKRNKAEVVVEAITAAAAVAAFLAAAAKDVLEVVGDAADAVGGEGTGAAVALITSTMSAMLFVLVLDKTTRALLSLSGLDI
jgi:hypothetical protein